MENKLAYYELKFKLNNFMKKFDEKQSWNVFVALEWSTVYMNNKFDDMINKAVNDQTPKKIESALNSY